MVERVISDKDKCLDKIFWFKLAIGLATGIIYGSMEVTGIIGFLIYFVASTILSFVYFKRFVNTDEEVEYQSEIFVEGLNVSIPAFMLCWIVSYTITQVSMTNSEIGSTLIN